VFLIICIIVVKKQLNFIQDKKLGFDKEQVMVVQLPNGAVYDKVEVMKNELLLNSDILNVATTSNIPGERIPFLTVKVPGDETQNMDGNEEDDDGIIGMRTWTAGFKMVETFGFEIVDGRSLSKEFGTDAEEAFLINEAAGREFEMENPVGHDFEYNWAVEVPIYQRQNCIIFSAERVELDTVTPDITTFWGWMNDIENVEMIDE
jgi:hypothetical protein